MLRFLTAGESHGKAQIVIIDGIPAGLEISENDIAIDLEKRRGGSGRGGRGAIEKDIPQILTGVRSGKTLGSPITVLIENIDYPNWKEIMNTEAIDSSSKKQHRLITPRPGHADLAGMQKYGFDDARNVFERASARETVTRVASGAIFRKLLSEFGIEIGSHTIRIGKIRLSDKTVKYSKIKNSYQIDPDIRCTDRESSEKMKQEIFTAIKNKDTLGGTVEVVVHNCPPGLGSHVHWDRKLDGLIAQSVMSIQSVKAVEIGNGIKSSSNYGSAVHDEITYVNGRCKRKSNNAGGIEGGISNGEDIVVKAFFKPISTLSKPLLSVNVITKKEDRAFIERSDVCVIPRAGIICEAAVSYILACCLLEKFGGDSLENIKAGYRKYIGNLTHFRL